MLECLYLTRVLQVRYLWIDSLCIIQTDRSDWERESARMADVYRNAYLTIAASNSKSDTVGFLGLREPAAAFCGS